MNDYVRRLEERWGYFHKSGSFWANGKMPFISDDARLNVLFTPLSVVDVENYFADILQARLHPELKEFYEWTNGCRLFFASLSVYGIRGETKDIFVPFDLEYENKNLLKTMPNDKWVYFASIGGAYVFAYDKELPSKVYGMKVGVKEILQTFDGVNAFVSHYFDALIEEYGLDGRRIHPTQAYIGIPVLENKCIELM